MSYGKLTARDRDAWEAFRAFCRDFLGIHSPKEHRVAKMAFWHGWVRGRENKDTDDEHDETDKP